MTTKRTATKFIRIWLREIDSAKITVSRVDVTGRHHTLIETHDPIQARARGEQAANAACVDLLDDIGWPASTTWQRELEARDAGRRTRKGLGR